MANAINSLNFNNNTYTFTLPYGVCGTAAATAAKTVTVDNFSLETGATVIVKFTYANSVASPTLNVNGTGAKSIMIYGTTTTSTGTTTNGWVAGAVQMFTYDGTNWIRDYWNNTTYSNASLGQGYATCSTAAATVAKTATLSSYAITTGGIVSVKFTNAVPANATLNINSKGAKPIYYRGSAIIEGIICAGEIATFIYDGTKYHLLTIDRNRFFTTLIPYGTAISTTGTDLNTTNFMKVGNYYCSANATAKTLLNCPTKIAFMMQVYSPLSTTIDNETSKTYIYRVRKLLTYQGDEYIQYCQVGATAGTWTYGSWTKIIKSTDIDGAISTVANDNLTASRALVSNSSGKIAVSAVTSTELGYLDGVTSSIQTQLNGKASTNIVTTNTDGLMSMEDKAKLDGIAAGAQVNSITGVKGNAESNYRTGNVNLTSANIGALALTGGTVTGATTFGSTLTVNGVTTFSNTTASSSTTTGAVKISGGLGVGGNIYANKVYNAVWNDYAELFPRGEETEPGDIIALDETAEEEKYIKAIKGHNALVGVHSNEYGHLIGGENCSIEENLQKYIPIGLAGRVWVKVHDEPGLGDYITASEIPGVGEKTNNRNQAIGIVVSKKQNGKVKIKII